jgi:hypothetical protein
LSGYREKTAYCAQVMSDSVIRRTKLGYRHLAVSWKQKVIMLLVRLRAAAILARI